ncbi:MAG: hypothetical protein AB7U52_04275 [Candidatus Izemoplasmatales bacterium]
MNNLQAQVFAESKKLIKSFNPIRFLFYFGITVSFTLVIFYFAELLDWFTLGIVIVLAVIYSLTRDLIISRFSSKLMDQFYTHLSAKDKDIDLYIPVLEKNFQGYFLKKTAIYFKGNDMFMEAFNQPRGKKDRQQSITIAYGKDFSVILGYLDKTKKTYLFQGTLMGTTYPFAVVANPEVITKINRRIKGEK